VSAWAELTICFMFKIVCRMYVVIIVLYKDIDVDKPPEDRLIMLTKACLEVSQMYHIFMSLPLGIRGIKCDVSHYVN
jgi:hypothetical protein